MTLGPVRGFLLRASPLVLAGLLLSCPIPLPPPEVEYSGCWAFYALPEPVCTLWSNRKLKLWVKTEPGDRVEIRAGDQKFEDTGDVARAGLRYALTIPEKASSLTVTVYPQTGGKDGATWFLRLAEPDKPAWLDEIGRLGSREARKRLEDLQGSAPREEQCLVLGALAKMARNPWEEEKSLQQRAALDRAHHHWSGEVTATTYLALRYSEQGRFSEAEQILKALQPPPKAPADNKFHVTYNLGALAEKTGNYSAALKRLQEASDLARRVGMPGLEKSADQILALVYQQLGRSQEASRLFVKLLAGPDLKTSCDVGVLWINVGWFQLMKHEAGEPAENPVPTLRKALAEFEKNRCSSHQLLNTHLNLALAYQQQDQWTEARWELAQAQVLAGHSTLPELLWQDDLGARAALHEGHPELALGLYEKLGKRSERAASSEGLLRALLGRAKAHLARRQRQPAIEALAQADRQIEEQSRHIPVDQGRDTFFSYQEAATRLYLELLLEEGQWQNAFDLARKSRSRLLRQLEVRDRLSQLNEEKQKEWIGSLSKYHATRAAVENAAAKRWDLAVNLKESALENEKEKLKDAQEDLDHALNALAGNGEGALSPPSRSEVILIYHPLPGKRWAAFAATEKGIVFAPFELPEKLPADPKLAGILLAPSPAFRLAIASAKSVRILPYGPLRSVDFHALPFDGGRPLLATHPVVYSLDLPRRSVSTPRSGRHTALVVSNPMQDLRTAEAEAKTVAAAIKRWPGPWTLTSLKGSDAQADPVRRALTQASFFHYVGHGSFGGFAGWSSELPLANQSSLTLSDVLALSSPPSSPPDSVVLSACDAGRTSEEAPGEGVGLANAFLLAGSKEVVAAMRLVPDDSANKLMAEMYRHWQPGKDLDLPQQFRRAQLACSNPSLCASWASFRLLVP